jgi:hypothetical protein
MLLCDLSTIPLVVNLILNYAQRSDLSKHTTCIIILKKSYWIKYYNNNVTASRSKANKKKSPIAL